jgi:hypothetical protein
VPYRIVPEVTVMLGDGRREKSTRLFFLEIRPYRSATPRKAPEPYLVAAYGVREVAPAAAEAPELPLLRERFMTRPTLTMGGLAQKEGPIELVIARDYKWYWPRLSDSSCFTGNDLHLMKTVFHPGQLLFGEADPEAVGTMKRGVKRRLTQGTGESAGSSTSSSRRSREAAPAADSPEKRRRDPPSQTRVGEKQKWVVRSPSPRPTSAASSGARLPQEMSTPRRRDETDKSVERSKDESPVRRTPAKKKRARKISSDSDGKGSGSSSSSDSSSSSNSSSSEGEAMAEDKVIDKSEEEQLRVLEEKQAAHKRLKSRMRKKATRSLIRKARRYEATLRKSQEAEKEAEETEAEQQEEEAAEAETSEADPEATEWEGRDRKERSIKRIGESGTSRRG